MRRFAVAEGMQAPTARRLGARLLLLALSLGLVVLPAQAQVVVAESQGSSVAALEARLDGGRRYTLQIDGPAGLPITVRYMQVWVSRQPGQGATGNDDGSFEATTPYALDLVAPAPSPLYWRYSVVVSPQEPADVAVRLLDRGPR